MGQRNFGRATGFWKPCGPVPASFKIVKSHTEIGQVSILDQGKKQGKSGKNQGIRN